MSDDQPIPEQKSVEPKPTAPGSSQDFFKHSSNLLLVASLLILVGFFLPWISIPTFSREVPTFNGTYILSNVSKIPKVSWIVLLFLISIPVGSGIVAYNSYRNISQIKTNIISISLATIIPVLVFFISFFAPELQGLGSLGISGGTFGLGLGMIMMISGSAYCLFFVYSHALKDSQPVNSRNLLKHGAIGASFTAVAILISYKLATGSPGLMVFLHLAIFATSIIISNNMHAQSIGRINYGRIIILGFVISVFTVIFLYILVNIFFSNIMRMIPNQGSLLFFYILVHIQFGLIISSISGALVNISSRVVPVVSPVAKSPDHTVEQAIVAETPAAAPTPPIDLGKFFLKNKMAFIIVSVLVVCGIVLWLIFKTDPISDAKKIASAYCDCSEKFYDGMIKADENFVNSFSTNNFKKRQEARTKLQELQNAVTANSAECNSKAQTSYSEIRNKYISSEEELKKFDVAYGSQLGTCNPANQGKLSSMNSEIESKISTIKDPEPDIEKIKSDLIGKNIPGWIFTSLSEIDQAKISNVVHGSNRVEYTIDLHLVGFRLKEPHDAQVFVTYSQEDDGWHFGDVKEIFYTYTNTAPVNNWAPVTPLQNCSYQIIDNGQRYWAQDGSYGTRYKAGGSDGEPYSLRSPIIYLMSREDHPVDLVFKYTPNN